MTTRWYLVKLLLLCSAVGLMLCALQVGAAEEKSGARMVNHGFSFGGLGVRENVGIEIMNFQYGASKAEGTYVDDASLTAGRVRQGGIVMGGMPVGDFLYVKWRILATGEVLEDSVDLKSLLPSDMDHKIIHFVLNGRQLIVYLIEGTTSLHAPAAPDCPAASYGPSRCTRIYPDHWSNF